ncbi:MAG: lipoyl domain-containing protein [Atribacterota bacterium]|nr:lipoyl domain-containing protein [Atribacterota bacterium]
MTEILMPKGSPDMETGIVVKWEKDEGAKVEKNEEIASIETDKAVVVIEAPCSGFLHIIVKEEEEVPVGNVIAKIYNSEDEYNNNT